MFLAKPFKASKLSSALPAFALASETTINTAKAEIVAIEYANESFVDTSGYEDYELVGKPHNIIRHPDMPKSTFKKIWDSLKAKEKMPFMSCSKLFLEKNVGVPPPR